MTDLVTYQGLLLDGSGHIKLNLQDEEVVIYSTHGSCKAFVLSGTALEVYRLLESGLTFEDVLRSSLIVDWEESTHKIIQFFLEEGLLSIKVPRSRDVVTHSTKSIAFWIHVTDTCNLRCDYCYVHKGRRRLSKEACGAIVHALKVDVEKHQVKEVELKFAGGEPLIDTAIIAYLINLANATLEPLGVKVKLSIITNGTLITDSKARFLKEKGFSVMVSLDGLGVFNDARKYMDGRPSVPQVLRGIERLLDAQIKPTILTTISDLNIDGLWDLMLYAREKGLMLSLSLSRDYEHGVGLRMNSNNVAIGIRDFLERICLLPNSELPRLSFNGIQFEGKRTRICGGGSNYFAVDPDANIYFCQMTVDKPFGHISDRDGVLSFASRVDTLDEAGDCGNCIWKYVCCGGCAVLAMSAGTLGKPSVVCKLMMSVLPAILVYEARNIRRKEVKYPWDPKS